MQKYFKTQSTTEYCTVRYVIQNVYRYMRSSIPHAIALVKLLILLYLESTMFELDSMERPYNVKKKEKSQHNHLGCHWPAWWQCDLVCAATMGFSINMLRPYNTKHFLTFLNGLQDDLFRHCHTLGSPHPLPFTGILISS